MKVVSVFCTNCGAAVQLDSQRQVGFCSYCGSQLLIDEEKRKIELSGNVSVDGMLTLENQIRSVETLCKLKQYSKAKTILEKLTHNYPEDYRVWWLSSYEFMSEPYNAQRGRYGENIPNHFSASAYKELNIKLNEAIENIKISLSLAPEEQRNKLGISAAKWLSSYIPYFEWSVEQTATFFEYIECYKIACKESGRKYLRAKSRRSNAQVGAAVIPIITLFLFLVLGVANDWRYDIFKPIGILIGIAIVVGWIWSKGSGPVNHTWSWYRNVELRKQLPITEEQYRSLFEGSLSEVLINDTIFQDVTFTTPSLSGIEARLEYIKNTTREFLATK
jgi:DNA-directed RNA polymerase subunit RPC12/RpoP